MRQLPSSVLGDSATGDQPQLEAPVRRTRRTKTVTRTSPRKKPKSKSKVRLKAKPKSKAKVKAKAKTKAKGRKIVSRARKTARPARAKHLGFTDRLRKVGGCISRLVSSSFLHRGPNGNGSEKTTVPATNGNGNGTHVQKPAVPSHLETFSMKQPGLIDPIPSLINSMCVTHWTKQHLLKISEQIVESDPAEYIILRPHQLGFSSPPRRAALLDRASFPKWAEINGLDGRELDWCAPNTGLRLLRSPRCLKLKKEQVLWIVMEPIPARRDEEDIFAIERQDDGRYLLATAKASYVYSLPLDCPCLFRLR